jgi:transcriptional regulator with XRE-family HTH domain
MEQTRQGVTLESFARRVECHFTTASRLRSGQRLPGRGLFGRIVAAYGLDPQEALEIYSSGTADEFGQFLRQHIFKGAPHSDEHEDPTDAPEPDRGLPVAV